MVFGFLSAVGSVYHTDGVAVVGFHSVDDEDSLISTPTKMFRAQMEYLRDNDISVISLKELYEALASSDPLPKKTVVLTFDDGFADVYENEVETTVMSLTSLLEPLMILFMAVIVGFIVLSICLPIFEMNELIR